MSYDISEYEVRYWNAMGGIPADIALVLAVFVLASALWIYQYKAARHALDRISFRIVLWSMAWEIVYSVNYLVVCGRPEFVEWYAKTRACIGGAYVMIGTIGVNNWLCTCIAVNLMMTICFNRNPISLGLEKWYVIGSTVLGLGVPIVPAAIGHLGYDPDFGTCHGSSNSVLDDGPATGSVVLTMACLIKHGRETKRVLIGGNTLNRDLHRVTLTDESNETNETVSSSWCFPAALTRRNHKAAKLIGLGQRKVKSGTRTLQDRLLEIALKISLYPVALIIVNGILTAGDLYLTGSGGVNSRSDFVLFLVYNFLYGGRGIIFACLGIFVDPCLSRGFKAVLRIRAQERRRQNPDEEHVVMSGKQTKESLKACREKHAHPPGKSSRDVENSFSKNDPVQTESGSTALDQLASLRYSATENVNLDSVEEGRSHDSMMPQLVVTFPNGRRSIVNDQTSLTETRDFENASQRFERPTGMENDEVDELAGAEKRIIKLESAQTSSSIVTRPAGGTKGVVTSLAPVNDQSGLVPLRTAQPHWRTVDENENAPTSRDREVNADLRDPQGQPPTMSLIRRGSERLVTETLEWEEVERLFQKAQAQL
ncbi:hypothetical protein IAT40_002125 [Kwoniella sp. CBS 6097]